MPSRLPAVDAPFQGTIATTAADSTAARPQIALSPAEAPNVVIVLLDDVGFGACSAFGGPIEMPTVDALAEEGLRFNQFHTTALCSPTRAALLTGRNHHQAHMGAICEIAVGFPGYDSIIPRSTATIGEIVRQNGYNTAWYGKGHVTPMWETSAAGPFDRWPTGLGFERFYGFLGGEASQWEPALFDQTTPVEAHVGKARYHLTEDLANQCISWIHAQKSAAPAKPFLIYFAPGAGHSPHHVWKEYADRYKGRFDGGWDALRAETYQRQIESGVIPPATRLTPRPEQVPAWDDYPERYRPVASRLMEVYAGFLSHTDEQVGRTVASLQGVGGLARGAAFAAGTMTARLIQGALFGFVFGVRAQSGEESSGKIVATLMLALGVVLLIAAYKVWSTQEDPDAPPPKWMRAINGMGAGKAFLFGALMVAIAAKQWFFSLGAVQLITAAGLGTVAGVALFLLFVLLAGSVLLVPLLFFVFSPERASATLGNWRNWLETHNHTIMITVSLVFGLFFLWKGFSGLLA